ncbi:hypothetical protein LCL98_14095 [Rossellomorea aquimaris]|nr:hypothetical protein [Rossellomorea aquimaris]
MLASILPVDNLSIDNGGFIDKHFEMNQVHGIRDYIRKSFKKRAIIYNNEAYQNTSTNILPIDETNIPKDDLLVIRQSADILSLLINENRIKKETAYIPFPNNNQMILEIGRDVEILILNSSETVWKFRYSPYETGEIEQAYYYRIPSQDILGGIKFNPSNFEICKEMVKMIQLIGTELVVQDHNLTNAMKEPHEKINKELKAMYNALEFTIQEEITIKDKKDCTDDESEQTSQNNILSNPAIASDFLHSQ